MTDLIHAKYRVGPVNNDPQTLAVALRRALFTSVEAAAVSKVQVKDAGIGFSETEATQLFCEFGRIQNERTKDIPGSGLGLSIVKRIVDQRGGRVSAKGVPGVGSTFTVVLPRKQSSKNGAGQ